MIESQEPSLAYNNGNGVFFKSDCISLLHKLKSDSIDLCFTDPPFNLGKKYEDPSFNDKLTQEDYYNWCREWLDEIVRVLKPGGALCVYAMPKFSIDIGYWLNQKTDLIYRSLIGLKMKSGFPIKGRLHPALYSILYYTKVGEKPTFNVVRHKTPICRKCKSEIRDYGGYRKKFEKYEDEDGIPWIQISDFWEDTRPARHDKSRANQVNELPIHIPERIILMASNENDVVLDVFGGGGSTFHAAQMYNRHWIGCDINENPCLSRFATIWGKEETDIINIEIKNCFADGYLEKCSDQKIKTDMNPIKDVPLLTNGHSLLKEDIVSKSKVLGF